MTVRVTVDAAGIDALGRALEQAPQQVAWAVDKAVRRAALEASREMRRLAPKAQSTLVQSIGIEKTADAEYLAGPTVNYAAAVERGTRGGGKLPPMQAIQDWLRVRRLVPRADAGGSRRSAAGRERDLAWAIARGIQRRGTRAQPFVAPVAAGPALKARLAQLLSAALGEGLGKAGLR